jgi:membrane protease YdiL (CAAX protease family)
MIDQAVLLMALLALAVVMIFVLWKWRLYEVPQVKPQATQRLALMTPLIGFLLFFTACAFVPALTTKAMNYGDTHGYTSFSEKETQNFSQLMALVVSAILLVGFSCIHPDAIKARIWGQGGYVKAFLKGIMYCCIAYPIVMTIVQGVHLVVDWFGLEPAQEQVALSQLKGIRSYPWLFWSFAVSVVTLVPLVEEFLFRGLLQNYFGNYGGPKISIIITSLLFALFHYSPLQGSTNIELLTGLFIYSYFIGLFYLREGSLFTPIAMHLTFNALTIFIMFYVI